MWGPPFWGVRAGPSVTVNHGDEPGTGYLEMATYAHKMRRAGNAMGMPLLLIAPLKGVGQRSWGEDFIVLGGGGVAPCPSGGGGRPPSPGPNGPGATGRSRQQRWAGLLQCTGQPDVPTSHSLKATMLSFLAKWGCKPDVSLILGHHAPRQRGLGMVHVYGRDVQAAPLRELERCLQDIRAGRFRPDAARSGMFTDAPDVTRVIPSAPVGGSSASPTRATPERVQ